MNKLWLPLTITCALVGILAGCGSRFVEFQPLKLQQGAQNKLIPAPELATPKYLEQVKVVLEFYGEKYKTNSTGALLIQSRLARDKELLWNYSNKALDDGFVEQARKGPKPSG